MKIQNISQDLLKRIEDNGGEISEENVTEENLDLNENCATKCALLPER